MTVVRRHLVALLAVVLGVAVGIALGAGPLTGAVADRFDPVESTGPASADLEPVVGDGFADEVVSAAAPVLYGEGLRGGGVALVLGPGVTPDVADDLAAQVRAAGGVVTGSVTLADALLNPQEKTLVDTLGVQLLDQVRPRDVAADLTTYPRLGVLLGLALTTRKPQVTAVPASSASILASLAAAELTVASDPPTRPAGHVVFVLGFDGGADRDAVIEGVVEGLSSAAVATVVAAPTDDASLERMRADVLESDAWSRVASVDGIDSAAGRVTTVLALLGWPDTRGRAFGSSGADGAVPLR